MYVQECVGQTDEKESETISANSWCCANEREREQGSLVLGSDAVGFLLPLLRLFVQREIRGHVTDLTQTGICCVGDDEHVLFSYAVG